MKLTDTRPVIESSGQMEEQFFSIKDQGMIFDILRSKMYSNPILAICREISCNARDAHREVGKSDVPIQIVLPNSLDWNYRIKDFGPGISPDRMSNIFIQYTASTKRDDNVQTGGFGLGAKTPFSYSDTFTIITIHNGIKYQYACYIDETKVGKLALLSLEETKEDNSTEIVIPVEPKDAKVFAEWTEHACRHWTVKPIVRGGTLEWKTPAPVLEGKGWMIANSGDRYNRQSKMIIDGIEYPLAIDVLRTYASTQLLDACVGDVLMYFGVGELTLSASREQIYLDKKTQDKIKNRLEEIQADIKSILAKKIEAFPDLWKANLYYRKELANAFHNLNFLGKLTWQGIELSTGYILVSCPSFTFSRGKYVRKVGMNPDKLTRSRTSSITFEENSDLYLCDFAIKEPTPKHVKKAFEDNPKLKSLQIICPTDVITEAILNKNIHLDKMVPKKLSDITKKPTRSYAISAIRLLVFKFDPVVATFKQVSYSSVDEDINNKVLCLLEKDTYPTNNRSPVINKNQNIALVALKAIADRDDKTSFYGVDIDIPTDRIKEDFGNIETLEEYIDSKVLNNKTINYVEIKYASSHKYQVDEGVIKYAAEFKKFLIHSDSLFLKRAAIHQKIKDISNGDVGLLQIYETVKGNISTKELEQFIKDNPEFNLTQINNEYKKTYPLLNSVDYYHYHEIIEDVSHYVNLIDGWNKDQKKKINQEQKNVK